jgi:hypothetical protein
MLELFSSLIFTDLNMVYISDISHSFTVLILVLRNIRSFSLQSVAVYFLCITF